MIKYKHCDRCVNLKKWIIYCASLALRVPVGHRHFVSPAVRLPFMLSPVVFVVYNFVSRAKKRAMLLGVALSICCWRISG